MRLSVGYNLIIIIIERMRGFNYFNIFLYWKYKCNNLLFVIKFLIEMNIGGVTSNPVK